MTVKVTLSSGKLAGMYEPESLTYYEQRRANQFIHVLPAIALSVEVIEKLDSLGCAIINAEDIDQHYKEERGSSQFWITLEEFKRHSSDFFASIQAGYAPQKCVGLAYWYPSREGMMRANPDKFCPVCHDYIADLEHVCEVGKRGPAKEYNQMEF